MFKEIMFTDIQYKYDGTVHINHLHQKPAASPLAKETTAG